MVKSSLAHQLYTNQPAMSSIDFGAKITGYEAKEWIRNILGDAEEGRIYDEEDFMTLLVKHKPKDFKAPRKPRASKISSSDRSEADYDCQLCDARVWNADPDTKKGLGGQCSRKKIDGECVCVIHVKEAGKHGGLLRNGLVTGPRPSHAYGDESQQLLPWHDVELPIKPTKKASSGGKRKCSNCGQPGHNKKTCPLLKENQSVEAVVHGVVEDLVTSVVKENTSVPDIADVADQEPEPEPEPDQEPEPKPEPEPLLSVVSEGEMSELVEQEPVPSTDTLEVDTSEADTADDDSGTIVFEGVEYTLDTEENEVYDDELSLVGTWKDGTVVFVNATEAKLHRVRKLGIKKHD